jgi:hypothetical protein
MSPVFYFFTFLNNRALRSALKIIFMGASLQGEPLNVPGKNLPFSLEQFPGEMAAKDQKLMYK